IRAKFGLLMREEIHAGRMINRPGPLVRIKRNDRLTIIRHLLDELAGMNFISLINVRIDNYHTRFFRQKTARELPSSHARCGREEFSITVKKWGHRKRDDWPPRRTFVPVEGGIERRPRSRH